MKSYETTTGRRFTLGSHTLVEWSLVVRDRLDKLDCSTWFIADEIDLIQKATEIPLVGRW